MVDRRQNRASKWIISLCLTAVVAVVGWTITGTQAAKIRTAEQMQTDIRIVESSQQTQEIRLSVLENEYDNIMKTLDEIKDLLKDND